MREIGLYYQAVGSISNLLGLRIQSLVKARCEFRHSQRHGGQPFSIQGPFPSSAFILVCYNIILVFPSVPSRLSVLPEGALIYSSHYRNGFSCRALDVPEVEMTSLSENMNGKA